MPIFGVSPLNRIVTSFLSSLATRTPARSRMSLAARCVTAYAVSPSRSSCACLRAASSALSFTQICARSLAASLLV